MKIPFGRRALNISLAPASHQSKSWEELIAVGMDDLELARLNRLNSRDPEDAHWDGMRLIYGGGRHA